MACKNANGYYLIVIQAQFPAPEEMAKIDFFLLGFVVRLRNFSPSPVT